MLERLRSDFKLSIIVLCGTGSALAILPFAAYRFARGDLLIAWIDVGMSAFILAAAAHAWRSGTTRLAGVAMSVVITAGLALLAGSTGHLAILWSYVLLLANFFIAPRLWALVANTLFVSVLLLRNGVFASDYEAVTYAVTAALVSLFAFIFAWRTGMQHQRLEALASHDPLTGAGNRRLMEAELKQVASATDEGAHAVAIFDLDRFKSVNDRFGHEAGDQVLRAFVAIVQESVRKFDRFYRFGGEEFVLLLAVGDEATLAHVLAKVHRQVRARLACPGGPVTVSIGAAMQRPGEVWTCWLARADAALYRAKDAGRDRLVIDGVDSDADASERRTTARHPHPNPL